VQYFLKGKITVFSHFGALLFCSCAKISSPKRSLFVREAFGALPRVQNENFLALEHSQGFLFCWGTLFHSPNRIFFVRELFGVLPRTENENFGFWSAPMSKPHFFPPSAPVNNFHKCKRPQVVSACYDKLYFLYESQLFFFRFITHMFIKFMSLYSSNSRINSHIFYTIFSCPVFADK